MKKILIILFLLLLTLSLPLAAQTTRQLKVYQKTGMVDVVRMNANGSIRHSCTDLNGQVHQDYVTMVVTDVEGHERQYLLTQLDSLVLPSGQRVVFNGSMLSQPLYAPRSTEWTEHPRSAPRRTSFGGSFPGKGTGNVTFYWTENDHIRLDVGDESRAVNLTNNNTSAEFVFEDSEFESPSYMVYYPDRSVTIPSVQTQTGADNTEHIGRSGDCGSATATRNDADGSYSFTLTHKAAYLCFLPHIDHLPSARIEKITLNCSSAIAGTYLLSESGLYNATRTSNTITLHLTPQKQKDFFIGHDVSSEQDTCAAYMVIAPQGSSQTFTATYYITDTLSHIEKIYRQTFSFQPVANTVYPVTCHILDEEFRTIDLGLSCNWSNVNVGATEPSRVGSQYATDAEANAALLEQTVVTEWLIPDADQREELMEKCLWEFGEYNGESGYLITGAAVSKEYGKKLRIFIPCAEGTTKEECLMQNKRPVEALMVDLGLPSGTKWAARNVGATSAEDYGYYYAWGEVETKDSYTSGNYLWGTRNLGDDYNISGTQNDAAAVNWGGIWRMPTYSEFSELSNGTYCSWRWSNINGVNGYIITGSNGNKIFLPASGLMVNQTCLGYNSIGSYATSTQGGNDSWYLWGMTFHSSDRNLRNDSYDIVWGWSNYCNHRVWGHSIRPVAAPNAMTKDGLVLNITTDSTSWKLGDTTARLYATLSSTRPITEALTVGFIIGDSANIVKGKELFDLNRQMTMAGSYDLSIDVYDNIGYWYRAYVETADTIFYGVARHYAYEMVDLGLSVKWANMNLGADQSSDFGYFYAWGETTTKDTYTSDNYQYGSRNLGENQNIAGTENDVAHVNMGNAWRMPTLAEMQELSNNCTWTWTSQNNVSGYRVTSNKKGYTDKSIFLPAAGVKVNSNLAGGYYYGSYPTSIQAGNNSWFLWALTFHSSDRNLRNDGYDIVWGWSNYSNYRPVGHCIRAVAQPNVIGQDGISYNIRTDSASWKQGDVQTRLYGTLSTTAPLKGEVTVGFVLGDSAQIVKGKERFLLEKQVSASGSYNLEVAVHDNIGCWYRAFVETPDTIFYGKARHYGYEMVDLGLSVKWANMNVGASNPEDCGHYFAWGEVTPKNSYSSVNYQYGASNLGNGLDITGTELDAAHVNMKNAWRMPTLAEMQELRDNCTWTWTTQNNVNGFLVTSKKPGYTNHSIFLPATGLWVNSNITGLNEYGSYATSRQGNYDSDFFYALTIRNSDKDIRNDGYDIVWSWSNYSNYRSWGHSVRAVASPNAVANGGSFVMNVLTDSATWKQGSTSAMIYGTISSTAPIIEGTQTGFVVGDSANITKNNATVYPQTTTGYGSFSQQITGLQNNIGYWYRAYVETPTGEVFYGTARHFGLEMVDLGLPSGTLWANMNVGADWPEETGYYYSWGETQPKSQYSSANYSVQPNISDISGTIYDAAYINMGSLWRLPTDGELSELLNTAYCQWSWTTLNNTRGYMVYSKQNGRSIFMPASGMMSGVSKVYDTTVGSYWSSKIGTENVYAQTFNFNISNRGVRGDSYSDVLGWNSFSNVRWAGRTVRAVATQKSK